MCTGTLGHEAQMDVDSECNREGRSIMHKMVMVEFKQILYAGLTLSFYWLLRTKVNELFTMSVSTRLVFSEVTISRQYSGQSCKKCLRSPEKGSLENCPTQREVGMPFSLLTTLHAPARAGIVWARSQSTSLTHTLATTARLR